MSDVRNADRLFQFLRSIVDGVGRKTLSIEKGKKRKVKDRKKPNNPHPHNPGIALSTDHFDLTMKRLEDLYLNPIQADVDSLEKSMSKIKICVEIVCVAIAGAAIVYVANTLLSLFGIT